MVSTFNERITELQGIVGNGNLTMKVKIDQVYARYQHERLDLRHPRGGQAKYLQAPLFAEHPKYYQRMANNLYRVGGLRRAMIYNVESLGRSARRLAPVEMGDLRNSANMKVYDRGRITFDKGPVQHRLTKAEERVKSRLRPTKQGGRGKR